MNKRKITSKKRVDIKSIYYSIEKIRIYNKKYNLIFSVRLSGKKYYSKHH